jgi:hypothetical protein
MDRGTAAAAAFEAAQRRLVARAIGIDAAAAQISEAATKSEKGERGEGRAGWGRCKKWWRGQLVGAERRAHGQPPPSALLSFSAAANHLRLFCPLLSFEVHSSPISHTDPAGDAKKLATSA